MVHGVLAVCLRFMASEYTSKNRLSIEFRMKFFRSKNCRITPYIIDN